MTDISGDLVVVLLDAQDSVPEPSIVDHAELSNADHAELSNADHTELLSTLSTSSKTVVGVPTVLRVRCVGRGPYWHLTLRRVQCPHFGRASVHW